MERLLNENEIEILLNLTLTAESNWQIIVGSPNTEMMEKLKNQFENELIVLENYENGSEILVAAAYKKPDLLILDENIEDISCKKIIDSLKKISELRSIKIICAINDTINNQSPDWGADDYFIKFNMDKLYLSKKINSILYTSLPKENTENKFIYSRKWPRINVGVRANIEFFESENPGNIICGEARILNISRKGAFLNQIILNNGQKSFNFTHIKIRIAEDPLKDFEAESLVVRHKEHEDTGVEFTKISKDDQLKIYMLFDK